MQLKIPKQNQYADCFEGVLASIAIHLNRHYEWMYFNEWKFRFNPPPIGTCYRLGVALELYRDKVGPLMRFHGIHYCQYPCENFDTLRNILETGLDEGMPIAVRADAYCCPWDKSFRKYQNPNHIFFINGLEAKTNCFICSDPFYQEWDRSIPEKEFMAMYTGQYGVFNITEDVSSLADGVETFQEMLKSLCDEATFDAIWRFGEEIEITDFTQEIDNDKAVWFAPVYRRMIEIANSRRRLPRFVKFVAEQYIRPDLLYSLPLLEEICDEWQQVKDLTLKLLITGNSIFQGRLAYKIKKIAETEEKAALTILSILGG